MIAPDKFKPALRTILEAILLARTRASEQQDQNRIAELLDDCEYLPALLLDSEDQTEKFREYVAEMAKRHRWERLLTQFARDECTCH